MTTWSNIAKCIKSWGKKNKPGVRSLSSYAVWMLPNPEGTWSANARAQLAYGLSVLATNDADWRDENNLDGRWNKKGVVT